MLRHARGLATLGDPELEARVIAIAEGAVERVKASLQTFLSENAHGAHSGGGALGRAAEFLFGYRGLPGTGSR